MTHGIEQEVVVEEGAEKVDVQENTQPDGASEQKPEGEKPEGEAEKTLEDTEQHKESRIQKRIDKLTREKYQLKGELEAMKKMQEQNIAPAPVASGKPSRDKFNNDEEWIEALTDYKAHQAVAAVKHEAGREQVQSTFNQQLTKARESHDDFDDIFDDIQSIKVAPPINEAIVASPFAAEILYELGKDMSKAQSLAQMPISSAIKEIGKIEAKIEGRIKPEDKTKKTTSAPPPIKPINGTGSAGKRNHIEYPNDYTVDEWRAAERKRIEKLKKG